MFGNNLRNNLISVNKAVLFKIIEINLFPRSRNNRRKMKRLRRKKRMNLFSMIKRKRKNIKWKISNK